MINAGSLLKHRWSGIDEVYTLLGIVPSGVAARFGHMAIVGNEYAILGRWDADEGRISTHSVEATDLERCYEEIE
jgi:hypothetical protein